MNNTIVLLVGKSGSGKTSVARRLEEKYDLKQVQSYTTRKPRYDGETGHTFVSDKQFDGLYDIVAQTNYDGVRYAATAGQIDMNDIYVIDPFGVESFLETYHGGKTYIIVYLSASKRVCKKRMIQRGDDKQSIKNRLKFDKSIFRDFEGKIYNTTIPKTFIINVDDKSIDEVADLVFHYMHCMYNF